LFSEAVPVSTSLPIWQIHAGIVGALRAGNRLVLVAPTGSGKTTQVPQMLLDEMGDGRWEMGDGKSDGKASPDLQSARPHLLPKKIVVLQPRRVAARTVAARVAWERECKLGGEVGYQIRFEDHTSLGTRICFVTEGILLRWLQDDRTLADVAAVLFDEFHERNLLSDVALALVKQLQETRRPDLKLVVMSATLDAEPVAAYLSAKAEDSVASDSKTGPSTCPILISEGQMFPVEINYADYLDERPFTEQAAMAVERIVNSGGRGDVLVFMPGMGEINATINALRAADLNERCAFIPLHGDLPPEQQDLAFAPNALRKIVVSTNVAETSVTIDGIRHVVDSGQARVARYDAERGIGTLLLEPISRGSADQRKGRAGRTAPGTCWRLWTESAHLNRPERNTPEIQRSDLAEVVLLLHSLGIKQAAEFNWLDKPDAQAVERAEKLLHVLGAIDATTESLTPIGRQMLKLPMHPRYSRMLVEAAKRGCVKAAALCAALVSGRDLLMRLGREDGHLKEARELFEASQDSDFFTLMRAFQFAKRAGFSPETCRRHGIHAQTAKQVDQTFEQILQVCERQRLLKEPAAGNQEAGETASDDALLRCLAAGFVDQLAVRRDQGSLECDLTEGRHGTLMRESVVQNSPLMVIASIREVAGRSYDNLTLLGLASAVKREWLDEMFPHLVGSEVQHLYDRTHKRVAAVKLVRFAGLVIAHEHQRDVEAVATGRCLAAAYGKGYFELPLLNHDLRQFSARVNLVCVAMPDLEFPPFDAEATQKCLARAFHGLTLTKEAQAMPLKEAFHAHLAPEQLGWLDELAPTHILWPDGRKVKLLYQERADFSAKEAESPEAQVRLQDCFPLKLHPLICEGTVPVKFWLCAPDGKRLDSTCDWPAFKTAGYPRLKPTLAKKYPGFLWP